MDSLSIARKLISYPSITPGDHGIFDYVVELLEKLNFQCKILEFGKGKDKVKNLYAQYGNLRPNICFAGHLDVVEPGGSWDYPPFDAIVNEGKLIGRGAADMKAAIAAWIAASSQAIPVIKGSISLLLTGDEEGPAKNGTVKVMEYIKANNIAIDACIVGEPTCEKVFGDIIKIGRRGSITYSLEVEGVQGHVAYPHLAQNPIDKLVAILHELKQTKLDEGNVDFQPSNLEIVNITVDNKPTNMIPESANAVFNIRYNNDQNETSLTKLVNVVCKKYVGKDKYRLISNNSAQAFLSNPKNLAKQLIKIVESVTGVTPKAGTQGGTSDARFIHNYCEVVEFGLQNTTAHKVNEYVRIEDLAKLQDIYYKLIIETQVSKD